MSPAKNWSWLWIRPVIRPINDGTWVYYCMEVDAGSISRYFSSNIRRPWHYRGHQKRRWGLHQNRDQNANGDEIPKGRGIRESNHISRSWVLCDPILYLPKGQQEEAQGWKKPWNKEGLVTKCFIPYICHWLISQRLWHQSCPNIWNFVYHRFTRLNSTSSLFVWKYCAFS